MDSKDEVIAQFIEISGSDEDVANFYLSSSNWSLEDALSNFLGNQGDDGQNQNQVESTTPAPAPVAANVKVESAEQFPMKSSAKPRFATLNDMAQGSPDNEEGQAFYAGGSERSGQQVLGPPKRKNFREQLTDMFRMAQEQSSAESAPAPSTSSGKSWGQGIRLGMTNSDHSVVKPETRDGEQTNRPTVILKLWSQGFSINDGELRPYDDADNKEFLETVMRGEIPNELLEMGWMVNVDVEDHRQEEYKKKSVPLKTFKGCGHTLGSPAPDIKDDSSTQSKASNQANIENEKKAKESLKLDTSAPTTSLQIRLEDGTRLAAQFNLTHTVEDIRQYIQNARPQYESRNYTLVSTFPTRELSDVKATIESAGLKNAALIQRIK